MALGAADLAALFATVWGEARGAGESDRRLVAQTLLRRAQLRGSSVAAEAHRPAQFSCWNPSDPNAGACAAWERALLAAFSVEVGASAPTHYHARSVAPAWAQGAIPCTSTPFHLYFNTIE